MSTHSESSGDGEVRHVSADLDSEVNELLERFEPGTPAVLECGTGWYGLIVQMDRALRRLRAELRYCQVKEKFGELRVYTTHDGDSLVDQAVDAAVAVASRTCEICGSDGALRTGTLPPRCSLHR